MVVGIADLLVPSAAIAVGFLFAVAFYESLSTRDVLVGRVMRFARRRTRRTSLIGPAYVATVGVGIPVLVVVWTAALEIALIVVGSLERLGNVALVAVAIVAAARILAYIREKTSHELAKAIPLALAFALLTGGAVRLDDNIALLLEEPDRSSLTTDMVVFLIALELSLRVLTDGSRALLMRVRASRGVADDTGVWRTLWAVVRGSVTPNEVR